MRGDRAVALPIGRSGLKALASAWRAVCPPGSPNRPDLVLVDSIGSTQQWARVLLDRCLADEDEPEPFLCAALEQSAGQGRDRRVWSSALGGIYATLVSRPASLEALQALPARTAIALAGVVNPILGGSCRIKWPNDLVVGKRKLGGILVDAVTPSEGAPWALVGFGINHSQRDFGAASDVATSLAAEVKLHLPFYEDLFAAVLAAVSQAAAASTDDWLESYRALSIHDAGDTLRARLPDRTIEGRFVGFDRNGFLELDAPEGRVVVRAGEVFSW